MRTTAKDVEDWIIKLKSHNIKEFRYKDLPVDLKKIGFIRKAKVIGYIKMKKRIKDIIVWEIIKN